MESTNNRIYLNVPFAEKDKAKALGARWDGEKRAWWIGPRVDLEPLKAWLPASSGHAPVFQGLDQKQWAIEDVELMRQIPELGPIEVIFAPWDCWKCHEQTWIFHAAVLNGGNAGALIEVTSLMYWPDILTQIDQARASFGIPRMAVIKPRFSKNVGDKYVSQGCAHCDALVGEFPLHEDFITIASEGVIFGNPDSKGKVQPHWPPDGLAALAEELDEYEE